MADDTGTDTGTNSTKQLVKLVAAGVSGATKSYAPKLKSVKKVRGKIFKSRGDTSEPMAGVVSKLTKDNPISDKKYDTTSAGSNYIQGIVGTPLANAPSVGADVNARLARLQNDVMTKIFKKDTGKIDIRLQAPVDRSAGAPHRISTSTVAMTKTKRKR